MSVSGFMRSLRNGFGARARASATRRERWWRDRIATLAERAVLARARRVEVAERGPFQPVCATVALEHVLDRELRFTVRIDRLRWMILGDRHLLGHAVDRRGRRQDEALHVARERRAEERDRRAEVVLVIELRIDHALA